MKPGGLRYLNTASVEEIEMLEFIGNYSETTILNNVKTFRGHAQLVSITS